MQAAEKIPPVCRLLEGFSSDRQACRPPPIHVPHSHPLVPIPLALPMLHIPRRVHSRPCTFCCECEDLLRRMRTSFEEDQPWNSRLLPEANGTRRTASEQQDQFRSEVIPYSLVRSNPRCRIHPVYVLYTRDNELYTPSQPCVHID